MGIRGYLPGLGSRSARQQWRELRQDALEMGVLAALFLAEWVKTSVLLVSALASGVEIGDLWWRWAVWAVFAAAFTAATVYQKRLARAKESVEEAAEEVVDGDS